MTILTVSAPGKLMLLGEHAVVYDRPCVVTSVDQRLYLQIEQLNESNLKIDAEDIGLTGYTKPINQLGTGIIPKSAQFIEFAIRNFSLQYPIISGIQVKTKSDFSSLFGFGSSSATAACMVKALSELLKINLGNKEIFEIAYQTVLDVQGKGSGFDIAAAVYGGTLYYWTGGKEIESLNVDNLPLIVGYTGTKADTSTLIDNVAQKAKVHGSIVDHIYSGCELLVKQAKGHLEKGEWSSLGELMNFNQGYLEALGVSTVKLSTMIYAARGAGAYGAKLSGAGGGDCMIAITNLKDKQFVEEAIMGVNGQVINVSVGVDGVRVEKENL